MEELKDGIVLFGGSFDPVQKSHIEIIQNLAERFKKAIVVPSFISPFKQGEQAVSGELRLKMLVESLSVTDNVEISSFELDNGGVSFTMDTALHISKKYKKSPLYVAIGTDMLAGLQKWDRIDELKELVTFYIIGRPGFMVKDSSVRNLLKRGIKLRFADFTGGEASSSQAKLDVAFDIYESIPTAAASMIQTKGLYSDYRFIVDVYPEFSLSEERVKHIYRTAAMAIHLAKIHKAPVRDAIVAALLHDIAKCATKEQLEKMGVALPEESFDAPEKVRHAFWGAAVAKNIFHIKKKSILDAIYYHTTGAPRMGKLAKILYLADLCEDGREEYEALFKIRTLAKTKLNAALLFALEDSITRLQKKGLPIHSLTQEAYACYQKTAQRTVTSGQNLLTPKSTVENEDKFVRTIAAKDENQLAHTIAAFLDEKKARDVIIVNLSGKTIVADYFVIATVGSTTAVRALTDYVDEKLSKEQGIEPLRRDLDAKWAAVDYGSVILHIQVDEVRKFYDLERLWNDGNNIERYN